MNVKIEKLIALEKLCVYSNSFDGLTQVEKC